MFIQRLFTAYLPPIWGWATLTWMRRREYVYQTLDVHGDVVLLITSSCTAGLARDA